MKKLFTILFYGIIITGILYVLFFWLDILDLNRGSNYNSLYLIPDNAVFIIESDKPFEAWDDIIHSNAWNKVRKVEFFYELNKELHSIDSIVTSNKILLKLFGSRKVLVSCHELMNGQYEFLYVVDLNKVSKIKDLKKYYSDILGEDYSINERKYDDYIIFDLYDKESGEIYYFSFVKDQLVFSETFDLIESSIDQTRILALGRDMNFKDIFKKISGKGLFDVYVSYEYFLPYMNHMLGKQNDFIRTLSESLYYTGIYFSIDEEGLIHIGGYTNTIDTVSSIYNVLLRSGNSKTEITEVVPAEIASLVKIGFDDVNIFYENMQIMLNKEGTSNYQETIDKMEKRLKISVKENLLGWIDDEIALIQTQPSYLGKENEYAVILKAKNKNSAQKNMEFISEQIKKNSPVKFKEIEYRNFEINYISFPGIFKLLFGKMLSKIEKPYFTIIDKYVILSNHPQTLKNIIDDYLIGRTISGSADHYKFLDHFNSESTVHVFLNTPVLFDNINELTGYQTWMKIKKNKEYINCFPYVGIQLNNDDGILKLSIFAQYTEDSSYIVPDHKGQVEIQENTLKEEEDKFNDTLISEEQVEEHELVIDDLDANKQEVFYDNGQMKLSVGLKNGMKQGIYKEYYENGILKVKGRYKNDEKTGTWKYYDIHGDQEDEIEY